MNSLLAIAVLLVFGVGSVVAEAQSPQPAPARQPAVSPETPVLGFAPSMELLQDLPLNNSPLAVLETVQPETTSDRFLSGGLNVATAPRFGSLLSSWTQTQFRIGDISITDPRAGGTPLFIPILSQWERMTILTGAMGVEDSAPGLSMTLEPRRPGTTWLHAIEGSASGGFLVSDQTGPAPAVDRLSHGYEGSALISGPVTDRLGLVATGWWRGSSHVATPAQTTASDQAISGFAHLVFQATPQDQVRVLGWVQRLSTDTPASIDRFADTLTDTAVHIQGTWQRRDPAKAAWRVFAGYTDDDRTASGVSSLVVNSITSDPVSSLIDPAVGMARRWTVGAHVAPPTGKFMPSAGVSVDGSQMRTDPAGIAEIREMVDGLPARVWTVHSGTTTDVRHLTTLAAYGNERVDVGRLTFEAGIRLDRTSGSGDGTVQGIQWVSWLPRSMLRWRIADRYGLELTGGYRRSAYQLPLNVLAFGDPAAPFADVSRWNGTTNGPLIARVGPGTGGDPSFAQIDSQLKRPITDELLLSLESHPTSWLGLRATGIVKREQQLLEVIDSAVNPSSYSVLQQTDPNATTPTKLSVYNRPPNAYGRDRYLLTNRTDTPANFWGMVTGVEIKSSKLIVRAEGAVLTRLAGPAAAGGPLPTTNDQDVLGNLFVDPNSATNARGQLFQDRTHTVKLAVVCPLPWQVRLGAIARYQDGQPFSRLVIAPDLTQGPTAVRAYVSGVSAFTYTGTLDIRVQKQLTTGPVGVHASVDIYNLPNLGNEVDERIVAGPAFRTPTALQPPRTVLLGMRVTF